MSANTPIGILKKVDFLDFFSPSGLASESVKRYANTVTVKRNEFVFRPKTLAQKIYFIKSGRIKIEAYSDDGKRIIKEVLQGGELFGELALFGEEHRTEFAQAMESTELLVLPLSQARSLMQESKRFSVQITQMIGNKLFRTQRRLESFVFKNAQSRVVEFLLNLAIEKGRPVGYETLVQKFFTHQEIANFTNTSRQTVTTILNKLRDENLIYFDRKRLLVRDLNNLKALLS